MEINEKLLKDVLQNLNLPDFLKDLPQNVGSTERIVSGIGGAVLGIYGLKNKESVPGVLAGIAAGALLFRSATGYCPLNQVLGRNSSEIEEEMD